MDAGNSLAPPPGSESSKEPSSGSAGEIGIEVLNRLGYDAVALGPSDVLLGRDELSQRVSEARGFSFVSANLVDKSTNQLFVAPYVIREVGGQKVALIGLTGDLTTADASFSVLDTMVSVKDAVRQAQAEAGIVILLSNAGMTMNSKIAQQVTGIDVIISGGSDPITQGERKGNGTIVAQAERSIPAEAGRLIGKLDVAFGASGEAASFVSKAVSLVPPMADDPDLAEWVASVTNE